MKKKLIYISGILSVLWGISHLVPTSSVVAGFGDISADNKLIITMEWIVEGLALIFLGVLTIITAGFGNKSKLEVYIYSLIIVMFLLLAVLSLFTGFRVDFVPFKLCPVIFSVSAVLIFAGMKYKSGTME